MAFGPFRSRGRKSELPTLLRNPQLLVAANPRGPLAANQREAWRKRFLLWQSTRDTPVLTCLVAPRSSFQGIIIDVQT
jgi:hypothetical protein